MPAWWPMPANSSCRRCRWWNRQRRRAKTTGNSPSGRATASVAARCGPPPPSVSGSPGSRRRGARRTSSAVPGRARGRSRRAQPRRRPRSASTMARDRTRTRFMSGSDVLGPVEFAVLEAVHRGALRSRLSARQVSALRDQPAGRRSSTKCCAAPNATASFAASAILRAGTTRSRPPAGTPTSRPPLPRGAPAAARAHRSRARAGELLRR
jgi:hypothetical protein